MFFEQTVNYFGPIMTGAKIWPVYSHGLYSRFEKRKSLFFYWL